MSVAPENLLKADFVVVFEKKSDGKKKDSAKPSKAGKPKAGSAPPKATSIPVSETDLQEVQQRTHVETQVVLKR